jgi:predicted phage-related endonuclease
MPLALPKQQKGFADKMIEEVVITSREQWLRDLRPKNVNASVVAALFGVHPHVSALKLYLAHSGIEFPEEDNPVLRRGRWLEPTIAKAVRELRPEWTVEECASYFRDPERRIGATPDFLIKGDRRGAGVLQAKSVAPTVYKSEWQSGAKIPFWVQLQNLTEAMLTGAAFGAVAVLVVDAYNMDCVIKEIPRHAGAEARIVAAVQQFWSDVQQGREPSPDYGKDSALLTLIAPHATVDKTIDLGGDNELPALLYQREQLMEEIKKFEERKAAIETELKFKMRDAERVVGLPEWNITWKDYSKKEFTVPAKTVRTLHIHHREGRHV